MRKQDRIARDDQTHAGQQRDSSSPQREPSSTEKMKGSASGDQPPRPQRQSGKLPLPD
jgi:hypothetical protein